MSRLTRIWKFGRRFSRNDATPSAESDPCPIAIIARAYIGWSAPSILHIICRVSATETAEVETAMSRASSTARS